MESNGQLVTPQGSFSPGQTPDAWLQLVSFHVGGEEFALDILRVQEIIRLMPLTRVPDSLDVLEGVMNLRGKIIPVIGLRRLLGMEFVPPGPQTRIVVVKTQKEVLGVIVDAVLEVLRLPAGSIEPPPRLGKVDPEYVSGVGKLQDRLIILLDADKVMSDPEMLGCARTRNHPNMGATQ
jgi:purine-binding chemotaxis protein CheW